MLRAPKDDLRSLFLPSFNIKRNIDRHLVLLSEIISRLRWKKELRAKMISCETHHSKKRPGARQKHVCDRREKQSFCQKSSSIVCEPANSFGFFSRLLAFLRSWLPARERCQDRVGAPQRVSSLLVECFVYFSSSPILRPQIISPLFVPTAHTARFSAKTFVMGVRHRVQCCIRNELEHTKLHFSLIWSLKWWCFSG